MLPQKLMKCVAAKTVSLAAGINARHHLWCRGSCAKKGCAHCQFPLDCKGVLDTLTSGGQSVPDPPGHALGGEGRGEDCFQWATQNAHVSHLCSQLVRKRECGWS